MLTSDQEELLYLEQELSSISTGGAHASAREAFQQQLDSALPGEDIRTQDVAVKYRKIKGDGGSEDSYRHDLTPHLEEIHDALDDPLIRVVAVKGPARGGKTIAAENFLLKVGMFGPSRNVLWYMHSEPDVKRYVKERVEFFLEHHTEVRAKLGNTRNPAWNLRTVDGNLWEWLAANASTTRARSASLAIADEVDAMRPGIRDSIVTLMKNRQREYGSQAKIFVASHPDAGPQFGIDAILRDSDLRVRMWTCIFCAHRMGPAVEVPVERRLRWNMSDFMERKDEMSRDNLVNLVGEKLRLVCPHCKGLITNEQRLEMRVLANWMGTGQEIDSFENIVGERVQKDTAGFVIHAFDAPFDSISEMGQQWVKAKIESLENGRSANLKEVNVKTLGETHTEDIAGARPRLEKEVRARLVDPSYQMGFVPEGVRFLTAMVDIQVNRFEVIVVGWAAHSRESWLIDRFNIAQKVGLEDVQPGKRLRDWDEIKPWVFDQLYPMQSDNHLGLGIAKAAIDTGGEPGVTNNARIWASNLVHTATIPPWRILLMKGDAWQKGELYGRPRKIETDDAGRPLATVIGERTVNVFEVKQIIAGRMEIETPGPGFMHLPTDIEDKYIRELCSETLVNGVWVKRGRNETWDGYVGCEVARSLLAPDNIDIPWDTDPPRWAVPVAKSPSGQDADKDSAPENLYDRLARFNRSRGVRR